MPPTSTKRKGRASRRSGLFGRRRRPSHGRRTARTGPLPPEPRRPSRARTMSQRAAGPVDTAGVSRHAGPPRRELLGVGLLVLGALAALGLWFDAAGPFGRVLRSAVTDLFGADGYALPIVLAFWAVLVFRGTPRTERGRMLMGLIITTLGVVGL